VWLERVRIVALGAKEQFCLEKRRRLAKKGKAAAGGRGVLLLACARLSPARLGCFTQRFNYKELGCF
jgi:hypothetical protein